MHFHVYVYDIIKQCCFSIPVNSSDCHDGFMITRVLGTRNALSGNRGFCGTRYRTLYPLSQFSKATILNCYKVYKFSKFFNKYLLKYLWKTVVFRYDYVLLGAFFSMVSTKELLLKTSHVSKESTSAKIDFLAQFQVQVHLQATAILI